MNRSDLFFVHLFLIALLTSAFAEIANAQATRNISSSARRIEEFNKQGENATRDEMNREMRGRKPTAEELRQAKAANAQIAEDLEALQTGYNEIVLKLQSRETPSDSFVAEKAERIHKHASRLRGLIKFPELNKDEAAVAAAGPETASLRKQLVALCTDILAFFDSSLFENASVLDVVKANEARQSLESIIQKSGKLKANPN